MSEINSNNFQTFGDDITFYPGQRVVKIGDKMLPVGIGTNAMPPVLSHITATAEDIVAGKVSVDSNGNDVVGSLVLPPVEKITATAEDTAVGKVGMDNTGNLFIGTFEGGGSMDFYRCASVDTVSKTWAGYKATFENGYYTFSTELTSGLSFSVITPEVWGIYTSDALVAVSSIYDGSDPTMVFYAPLAVSATANTGQKLTINGTVEFTENETIPCCRITKSAELVYAGDDKLPTGLADRTLSFWAKSANSGSDTWNYMFGYGNPDAGNGDFIVAQNEGNYIGVDKYYADFIYRDATVNFTKWHHIAVTFSGEVTSFYIDGELLGQCSGAADTQNTRIRIGNISSWGFDGYIASCRIYNRVLSADEIAELSTEFDPQIPKLLQFHAPLAASASAAETGQPLSVDGEVVFGTVDGIPCATFNRNGRISSTDAGLPTGNSARTVAFWVKLAANSSAMQAVSYGTPSQNKRYSIGYSGNILHVYGNSNTAAFNEMVFDNDKWYHVALTLDGTEEKLFCDGTLKQTNTHNNLQTTLAMLCIGSHAESNMADLFMGSIADVRIYNYVLTDAEIAELAKEFLPTA